MSLLEQEAYTSKPFGTRVEYVELVMAILRSPDYRDQMRRKHKGVDVQTILARFDSCERRIPVERGPLHYGDGREDAYIAPQWGKRRTRHYLFTLTRVAHLFNYAFFWVKLRLAP